MLNSNLKSDIRKCFLKKTWKKTKTVGPSLTECQNYESKQNKILTYITAFPDPARQALALEIIVELLIASAVRTRTRLAHSYLGLALLARVASDARAFELDRAHFLT
jgi:hypothetical protein